MKNILQEIKRSVLKYKGKIKIIFPDGNNVNVQQAALRLKQESNIEPVLVFKNRFEAEPFILTFHCSIIDEYNLPELAKELFEIKKNKLKNLEEAKILILKPEYFAAMMLKKNYVQGYVGGIDMTTRESVLPLLEIIKGAKEYKKISSFMLLKKGSQYLIFADCAININPTSEILVDITKATCDFAKNILNFQDLNVALLSYSTNASGKGPSVEMVQKAIALLKEDLSFIAKVDYEYQFDAAFDWKIREKKTSNSILKPKEPANIYIFPDLNSGNIGYKIAQRMGGYQNIGPILIGLNQPASDLSRGADVEEIINITYLTAMQYIINFSKIKEV